MYQVGAGAAAFFFTERAVVEVRAVHEKEDCGGEHFTIQFLNPAKWWRRSDLSLNLIPPSPTHNMYFLEVVHF